MKKPNITADARYNFKTGQYFPTLNGIDSSPSSFDELAALTEARRQAHKAMETTKQEALPKLLEALENALEEAENCEESLEGLIGLKNYILDMVPPALLAAGYTE